MNGWIGVDLDGTLAEYHGWLSEEHIGPPIGPMVDRVKRWLAEGREVRIFTARVDDSKPGSGERRLIEQWCVAHIGVALRVTNVKDICMIELWDDRCVQVTPNKGEPVGLQHQELTEIFMATARTRAAQLPMDSVKEIAAMEPELDLEFNLLAMIAKAAVAAMLIATRERIASVN